MGKPGMNEWMADKRWSDRFLPEIKQILGLYLIGEPPQEEDSERNTDLMVLKMDAVRIACRVRRHEYYERYPGDITIRAGRPSGMKTELTKIIEGWGEYFFYGFSDKEEARLEAWRLCDLKAFRIWLVRSIWPGRETPEIPGTKRNNNDDSSSFLAFKADEIPGFVIATKNVSSPK